MVDGFNLYHFAILSKVLYTFSTLEACAVGLKLQFLSEGGDSSQDSSLLTKRSRSHYNDNVGRVEIREIVQIR